MKGHLCALLQCKHMLSSICCSIEAVSFPVQPANQPAFLCSPALEGKREQDLHKLLTEKKKKKKNPGYDTHIQADTQMENDLAVCYTNTTSAALSLLLDLFNWWDEIIRTCH